MKSLHHFLYDYIFSLFSPKICVVCGNVLKNKKAICDSCFAEIDFISDRCCPKCSLPVLGDCPDCLEIDMKFDKLFSLFLYDGVGKEIIHQFKFRAKFSVVDDFVEMMKEKLGNIEFDVIVPVPSDTEKYVKRGYNPSFFIAEKLHKISGKKIFHALRKVKNIPSQLDLKREERIENVKGAFQEVEGLRKSDLTVLLVDDVATTCATLSECSGILKRYFPCVFAFTLARAQRIF